MYGRGGYAPRPPAGSGPGGIYTASDIINDSGVAGDNVKEALDTLNIAVGGGFVQDNFTLTAQQVVNKSVFLSNTPAPGGPVDFKIQGASVNLQGLDFDINGSTLTWNGLRPDGKIKVGDMISVTYRII